mmetsp:Transcript_13488/g.29211  ORF Transcript_13488/g.29211 Transcript_13488/m.29211 type:complete len:202 (-) Transcript_13488:176-781(-)
MKKDFYLMKTSQDKIVESNASLKESTKSFFDKHKKLSLAINLSRNGAESTVRANKKLAFQLMRVNARMCAFMEQNHHFLAAIDTKTDEKPVSYTKGELLKLFALKSKANLGTDSSHGGNKAPVSSSKKLDFSNANLMKLGIESKFGSLSSRSIANDNNSDDKHKSFNKVQLLRSKIKVNISKNASKSRSVDPHKNDKDQNE